MPSSRKSGAPTTQRRSRADAVTRCTLKSFQAKTGMRSALSGPSAYPRIVRALLRLPGVRLLERSSGAVLLSVRPVPSSMERGLGLFVLVRPVDDDVLLLARHRLPLPPRHLDAALRHLERDARQLCSDT